MSMVQLVPTWRLTDRMVRSGLVMAWRLATSPTSTSPFLAKATTDGVVRLPSALGMTTGSPASRTATTEFVVPRSIPTALGMVCCSCVRGCQGEGRAKGLPADSQPATRKLECDVSNFSGKLGIPAPENHAGAPTGPLPGSSPPPTGSSRPPPVGQTLPMTSTLVLVRHGQSTWNLENLFTGWYDADLTDQGRAEATAAGAAMADAE